MFVSTMVPQLLESHMGLLFQSKTQFVASNVLDLSIRFIECSVRIPQLFGII